MCAVFLRAQNRVMGINKAEPRTALAMIISSQASKYKRLIQERRVYRGPEDRPSLLASPGPPSGSSESTASSTRAHRRRAHRRRAYRCLAIRAASRLSSISRSRSAASSLAFSAYQRVREGEAVRGGVRGCEAGKTFEGGAASKRVAPGCSASTTLSCLSSASEPNPGSHAPSSSPCAGSCAACRSRHRPLSPWPRPPCLEGGVAEGG